jgi:hypothetical protein
MEKTEARIVKVEAAIAEAEAAVAAGDATAVERAVLDKRLSLASSLSTSSDTQGTRPAALALHRDGGSDAILSDNSWLAHDAGASTLPVSHKQLLGNRVVAEPGAQVSTTETSAPLMPSPPPSASSAGAPRRIESAVSGSDKSFAVGPGNPLDESFSARRKNVRADLDEGYASDASDEAIVAAIRRASGSN